MTDVHDVLTRVARIAAVLAARVCPLKSNSVLPCAVLVLGGVVALPALELLFNDVLLRRTVGAYCAIVCTRAGSV
jgi:hypothetical protein